jgi:hypothetical protein
VAVSAYATDFRARSARVEVGVERMTDAGVVAWSGATVLLERDGAGQWSVSGVHR